MDDPLVVYEVVTDVGYLFYCERVMLTIHEDETRLVKDKKR